MIRTTSVLALLTVALSAPAQPAATLASSSVIIPSQFASAKTVFVGYAGAAAAVASLEGSAVGPQESELVFTEIQGALIRDGRYKVVAKPADADLSMRLSVEPAFSDNPSYTLYLFIRLAIYDSKTGMLLWTLEAPLSKDFRKKSLQKNIDDASAKIVGELSALAAGKLP